MKKFVFMTLLQVGGGGGDGGDDGGDGGGGGGGGGVKFIGLNFEIEFFFSQRMNV